MKKVNLLLIALAIIFASIYLTFIVDVYTLNTFGKRFFVFLYFLVICSVIVILKKRLLKKRKTSNTTCLVYLIIAALAVIVGHNFFLPRATTTTLSISAVPCDDGIYREIWLTSLRVDEKEIQLSKLPLDANQGWLYHEEYGSYVFYPDENSNNNANYLTFETVGQKTELVFARNAWSGTVNIIENAADNFKLNLNGEGNDVIHVVQAAKDYSALEILIYGIGAWICMIYLINILFLCIFYKYNEEKYSEAIVTIGLVISCCLLSIVLDFCGYLKTFPLFPKYAFIIFNACILIYATQLVRKRHKSAKGAFAWRDKNKSKADACVFFLLVFVQTFLFSYNQIVSTPFSLRNGALRTITICALFMIYSSAWGVVEIHLLNKFDHFRNKNGNLIIGRDRALIFMIIWLVLVGMWFLWWRAYFPANMSPDSVDQWQMAIGINPWHDAHPLFSTLWVTFCSKIWKSPGSVVLMQILIGATVYATILTSFISRGLPKKMILLLGMGIALLPNMSMYMVTQWKDVPFLLMLICLAFLTHKVISEEKMSFADLLMLTVAMFCVSVWRHNGFLIAGSSGIILAINAFIKKKIRIGIVLITALLSIQIFNVSIYKKLGIEHYGIGLAGLVVDCVGYTLYYDGDVPDDILEEATEDVSIDFWRDQFAPFHGFNYVYNGEHNLSSIYANKSTMEQLSIVFRLLIRNPEIIFFERMAMNDANLFVFQSPSEEALNSRYAYGISENDVGLKPERNFLTDVFDGILNRTSYEDPLLDSVFWRNGLMICVILWVIYYSYIKRRLYRCIFFVPMIFNFMTLFIALTEQSYRFTHNIIPYTIFGILCVTAPNIREKGNKLMQFDEKT